jgi:hypothetical protein
MRKRRRPDSSKDQGPIFGLERHDVYHHCRDRLLSTPISAPPRLLVLLLAALLCCSVTSAARPRARSSSLSRSTGASSSSSLVRGSASRHSSTAATTGPKARPAPPAAKHTPHPARKPVLPPLPHAAHAPRPPPSSSASGGGPAPGAARPVVRVQQAAPPEPPELPPPGARSLDLQFFEGSLAGAAPPGILWSADPARQFRVDNQTFVSPRQDRKGSPATDMTAKQADFKVAGEHSCGLQMAACAKAAAAAGGRSNGPPAAVSVADCEAQKGELRCFLFVVDRT